MDQKFRGVLILIVIFLIPAVFEAQFGTNKEHITMMRRIVPSFILPARPLQVQVTAKATEGFGSEQTIAQLVGGYITDALPDLKIVSSDSSSLLLSCSLEYLNTDKNQETQYDYEYRRVGTKQEWNEKKKVWETKDDYQNVPVSWISTSVSGSATAVCTTTDQKARGELRHTNASASYSATQSGRYDWVPDEETARRALLEEVSWKISADLAPVKEPVRVILAKNGPLKKGNQLLNDADDAGRPLPWEQAAAMWEKLSGLSSKDEAYRSFNLALAYEAMAYQEPDLNRSQELLNKAAGLYDRAIQLRHDEKYFSEPSARIQDAVQSMTRLKQLYSERGHAPKATIVLQTGGKTVATSSDDDQEILTNSSIIALTKAGLGSSVIMQKINSSRCDFKTSADELIALKKAGISDQVIRLMIEVSNSQ
ncbi:hypothetical protein L0152_19560 [bacterium]|nr:hypothetical protein [bacterium]